MCNSNGCYGGCCDPEEMTKAEQKLFLEEKLAILKAKQETVEKLLKELDKKSDSDKE